MMDKQLNARISPNLYARIKSAQVDSKLTTNTLVEQLLEIGLNAYLKGNISTDSNCYVTQSDFESFRGEMLGKFKSLTEQLSQAKTQNLTVSEILESTLPKRVVDIEADSKPPVNPVARQSAKAITYNLADDGSIVVRSVRGIDGKKLKTLTDEKLLAIGLERLNDKFYPVLEPLHIVSQIEP